MKKNENLYLDSYEKLIFKGKEDNHLLIGILEEGSIVKLDNYYLHYAKIFKFKV